MAVQHKPTSILNKPKPGNGEAVDGKYTAQERADFIEGQMDALMDEDDEEEETPDEK